MGEVVPTTSKPPPLTPGSSLLCMSSLYLRHMVKIQIITRIAGYCEIAQNVPTIVLKRHKIKLFFFLNQKLVSFFLGGVIKGSEQKIRT